MILFKYTAFVELRASIEAIEDLRLISAVKMNLSDENKHMKIAPDKWVELEFHNESDETHFRLKYL